MADSIVLHRVKDRPIPRGMNVTRGPQCEFKPGSEGGYGLKRVAACVAGCCTADQTAAALKVEVSSRFVAPKRAVQIKRLLRVVYEAGAGHVTGGVSASHRQLDD